MPKAAPLPSREQVLDYIRGNDGTVNKREIARAFGLNADQRVELRRMLKDLQNDGVIERRRGRRFSRPGALPSVAVVEISGLDTDGEVFARPVGWEGPEAPRIFVAPEKRGRSALGIGERVLARLKSVGPDMYEAQVIRRLVAPRPRTLGIYSLVGNEGRILPIDRRQRDELVVPPGDSLDAEPGELVWVETRSARPLGLRHAKVVERLGPTSGPRSITMITIHDHDIPVAFSAAALAEAEAAGPAPAEGRDDLRDCPLVTIDGADARDFDDAVWAEADPSPDNAGGWHLLVAIADVAWYVRRGSALDSAAGERGNSVYFPDRVVPMLPEALSNGWCSLVPAEDRPCLAAHMWIDADGRLIGHRFVRGLMRSAARLTYEQVQAAVDGQPDDRTAPLLEPVIRPLYGAYAALARGRAARGVLELDVPERRVAIAEDGSVAGIHVRERVDSHKLIEEFMIAANVAAAETLERRKVPCLYRVHDRPSLEKLRSLREFLDTIGIGLPRGDALKPKDFNRILERAAGRPEARLVNEVVLRSQAQAAYDPENIGHFGLALRRYAHFTSPIRRYADLVVHRRLIGALALGPGGTGADDDDHLSPVADHISATERRAAAAERDATDRFTASFLADRVGAAFRGRINGVTRFGLFVTLDDTGADGLVPVASLPDDYYVHDASAHRLTGRTYGLTFRLGDRVEARLVEANPVTGGLILELLSGIPEKGRPRTGVRPPSPADRRRSDRRPGRRR
jgi:ribonuclease R